MTLINLKLKNKFYCDHCRSDYNRYLIFVQHIFYKIIGLSAWSLDMSDIIFKKPTNDNNEIILCKISYLGSCYNFLLCLLISSSNFYLLFNPTFFHVQSDQILTHTVRAKVKFFAVLCITFIPLIYICRQKLIIGVINRLINVDEKLKHCRSYKVGKKNHDIYFIFIINFFIFISRILMTSFYFRSSPIIVHLIRLFPDIISSWVVTQYSVLLKIIYNRFKSINLGISKLGNIKNELNVNQKEILGFNELLASEIKNIKFAYTELCEICHDSADFYGLPILISIIHHVAISIMRLYFVALSLLRIQKITNILYVCYGIVIGFTIYLIIILTSAVTKTTKQSNKTGRIINLLMDRCTMDEKIEKQLAKFSSDTLHLKVEFTAYDVIPLDRKLLVMIVGTVATYLIIVIQFNFTAASNG